MDDSTRKTATLDDLFRVKMPVTVGTREFWLRALSEFDQQARDEYAQDAKSQKRRAFDRADSPEYLRYVAELDGEDDERLRAALVYSERLELAREARDPELHPGLQPQLYPFPDGADDEEKDAVRAQREAEAPRITALRDEWVKQQLETRTSKMDALDHAALVRQVRSRQKDVHGSDAFQRAFTDYTLYAAVFRDASCEQRVFAQPEDAREFAPQARAILLGKYFAELDTLTGDDIKYFFSMGASRLEVSPTLA